MNSSIRISPPQAVNHNANQKYPESPLNFNDPLKVLLTPREIEVLDLIARGFTAKVIAQILGISQHTVRTHRDNLRRKFGARNTAQLGYYHAALKIGSMVAAAPAVPISPPVAKLDNWPPAAGTSFR
ncbi:conserved hypothetical protein [Burkholderiales bacterium 8X]|nr:conserved hypothetical protein [Burkholderiales bacterium 8X]